MIKAIASTKNTVNFYSGKDKEHDKNVTRILPNNAKTKFEQGTQKTMSAFIDYPVKGFKGDINTNFYEFLTMGIVPYLMGSAAFMFVFNCVNKHLVTRGKSDAQGLGKKLALGVIFYGILKNLSKNLVTKPVKAATGVDTEMPYENIVYNLPKHAGDNAVIEVQHQQRKIFDSKEFYRKDLLDRTYFDNIAKKVGLGENLEDSITEVSPIIQNIAATSGTAKSISSYCWAGIGVALANQDAWLTFFDKIKNRNHYQAKTTDNALQKIGGKVKTFWGNVGTITDSFFRSLVKATKQLWTGKPGANGFAKHSGKAFIGAATFITAFLTTNTIVRAKNMAKNNNKQTIDKTKEITEI